MILIIYVGLLVAGAVYGGIIGFLLAIIAIALLEK